MKPVEIRTYQPHPGTSDRSTAAFKQALPVIRSSGMHVVAFGRSDHEHESFYLIRAYADRAHLDAQQGTFNASKAWRDGQRGTLVACIASYLNTLIWLSDSSVEDLRIRNGIGADVAPASGPTPG